MKTLLLAAASTVLFALPLQAQSSVQPGAIQYEPVTVVSITGTVESVRAGLPPLPFEVLEQIERDPFLAGLSTEPQEGTGPALALTHSFPNVQAYRAWSEAPQTRELLEVLRQRVGAFDLTVDLIRSQNTMILPANPAGS
ncbi:hypothetical protein [Longimicrobium terrae]|uniref:ABM domain-containing protein n=1 Tax=Longimicrobium terrae TaxID=1639882 RepID=A0A841H038_9BACT|nr:hypothetical protein [Longimicrobium terrae]MBB4637020.1 hypothetical protein [Longimicrobium terrae]MBB6071372.1 hypothetical protein [Longimicrobium terrae]NNC31410.1 hypothetical protein [Longimicrobium terrae]